MAKAMHRHYGNRARIGLVVPSPNTVAETEFWRMAPPGVTVHTSRMPIDFALGMDAIPAMEKQAPRVLKEAATAAPSIIAYGCTATSAVSEPEKKQTKIGDVTGLPTVTAAMALLDALKALSVSRIGLVTPYPPAINEKEVSFFSANGINVIADESVIADPSQLQMRNMCLVPPDLLIERAVEMGQHEDVECVVLSCCDMPTLDAINSVESAINKPVISSTQALFWKSLREAGLTDFLDDAGKLFVQ